MLSVRDESEVSGETKDCSPCLQSAATDTSSVDCINCWVIALFGNLLLLTYNIRFCWPRVLSAKLVSLSYVIFLAALLTIKRKQLMELSCHLSRLSVGLSVCTESVLWQNGWLDPDAVWNGEWVQSKDGCNRWGGDRRRGRDSFGVNLERPTVTNGDFETWLFPNYFGQDLLFNTVALLLFTVTVAGVGLKPFLLGRRKLWLL